MRLLLDTHLLLWAAMWTRESPGKLPAGAVELIQAPTNDLSFSAASLWEVAIKHGLRREDFTADPHLLRRGLLDNGYGELAILGAHALAVMNLPPLHKDPFDRMLIAQAIVEGMTLLTCDPRIASYPGPIRMV